jgi:hypothetical protein
VVAGISAALSVGSTNVDVVALEARKATERRGGSHGPQNGSCDGADVVVLAAHRSAPPVLVDERPVPSVAKYDTLLGLQTS